MQALPTAFIYARTLKRNDSLPRQILNFGCTWRRSEFLLLFAASTWSTKSSIEFCNNALAVCQTRAEVRPRVEQERVPYASEPRRDEDFDLAAKKLSRRCAVITKKPSPSCGRRQNTNVWSEAYLNHPQLPQTT